MSEEWEQERPSRKSLHGWRREHPRWTRKMASGTCTSRGWFYLKGATIPLSLWLEWKVLQLQSHVSSLAPVHTFWTLLWSIVPKMRPRWRCLVVLSRLSCDLIFFFPVSFSPPQYSATWFDSIPAVWSNGHKVALETHGTATSWCLLKKAKNETQSVP